MADVLLLTGKECFSGCLLIVSYHTHQGANIIKDELLDLSLINVVRRAIILAITGISTALVKLPHHDMRIACCMLSVDLTASVPNFLRNDRLMCIFDHNPLALILHDLLMILV